MLSEDAAGHRESQGRTHAVPSDKITKRLAWQCPGPGCCHPSEQPSPLASGNSWALGCSSGILAKSGALRVCLALETGGMEVKLEWYFDARPAAPGAGDAGGSNRRGLIADPDALVQELTTDLS